jgi:hypothetical protein
MCVLFGTLWTGSELKPRAFVLHHGETQSSVSGIKII